MRFTSISTALLAAANFAVATPVQSEGGVLTTLKTRQQWQNPVCVQGLIYPYSKKDLNDLRNWFLTETPDVNDHVGINGWFTWTLGSLRVSCSIPFVFGRIDADVCRRSASTTPTPTAQ